MNRHLETIELRTSGQNREKLECILEKLLAGLRSNGEQEQIRVYNNRLIESDYCIHLHIQAEQSNKEGSPLGLRMVSALRDYGLVHHNIWCEMSFGQLGVNQEKVENVKQTGEQP